MKLRIALSPAQAYALRRLDGEPGSTGVAAPTWRALERLKLVRWQEIGDGDGRWILTVDGANVARRLREGGGS